jgi:hypothetical protein
MILPTIHLNGSSPVRLQEGYMTAHEKVLDAIRALKDIEFNGRDYYPQGPDAWRQAAAEFAPRLQALTKVDADLVKIIEHIQDSIDARERQTAR